ncbi:MAG: RrF2 family transcriptional regulator [Phycisphaerae bacterium]
MLSKTGEHALRAMVFLAQQQGEEPVSGPRMAEELSIPQRYLSAILGDLVRGGVLTSVRGKGGGFSLVRRPDQIRLAEVLGPFEPVLHANRSPCPFGNPVCNDDDPCAGHDRWKPIKVAYAEFLHNTSLEDVSQEKKRRRAKRRGRAK